MEAESRLPAWAARCPSLVSGGLASIHVCFSVCTCFWKASRWTFFLIENLSSHLQMWAIPIQMTRGDSARPSVSLAWGSRPGEVRCSPVGPVLQETGWGALAARREAPTGL